MIAFIYANILALRLRYTDEEHSGEISGFLVVNILKIQPFKVSFYMPFSPFRLKCQHLRYHIYIVYKARALKLATLTNWDLIFHILLSE